MLFLIYGTLRRAANLPARSDTEGSLSHMQPTLLILLGLAAGTLSGMLGIGGGIIIVPALHQLFKVPMNQAVGTSPLIIIPTALTGSITQYMKGNLTVGRAPGPPARPASRGKAGCGGRAPAGCGTQPAPRRPRTDGRGAGGALSRRPRRRGGGARPPASRRPRASPGARPRLARLVPCAA